MKLTIGNSLSQIEGLSAGDHKSLRALLSYKIDDQAAYFAGGYQQVKYLIDKKGFFPTGLLYLVYGWLEGKDFELDDTRKVPKRFKEPLKLELAFTPYPEQLEAAQAALAHHRGVIVAPTGVGKSVIVALIIHALQVRTLVVVPSLELKRQLTEGLKEAFGELVVGSGRQIVVENVDGLDLTKEVEHDCVIIDEFHHAGAETYRKANLKTWNNVYYRFGLTATPFRSKDEEKILLESVLSQVIYRVPYTHAVKQGYIVPMEAYYVELPVKKGSDAHTWAQVYAEFVVNNQDRNQVLADILKNMENLGVSALCLVKEIKHGEALAALTGIPFAHGQAEDKSELIVQFNARKINVLIGTTGVLGEGIDTRPCEYVIVAGLGKSRNQFMQQAGRGFRRFEGKESCKVIIFRDASHKFTRRHFQEQCKIIEEEYGIKPVKI